MKGKWMMQSAALVAIVVLVLGTAGYYWLHPDNRGQDLRGFDHGPRDFQQQRQ